MRTPIQPTEAMMNAAIKAYCQTGGSDAIAFEDREPNERQLIYAALYHGMFAGLHIDRRDGIDLPVSEPPTCGSDYLVAERAMRLLESAGFGAEITAEGVDAITSLADRAGVAFARERLMGGGPLTDDLPF